MEGVEIKLRISFIVDCMARFMINQHKNVERKKDNECNKFWLLDMVKEEKVDTEPICDFMRNENRYQTF